MWSFCKEKGAFAKKNKWLTPTRAVSVLCVRFPPTVGKGCWSGHSMLGTVTGDPVGVGKTRASTVHITLPPDLPPALPSTKGIRDPVLHSGTKGGDRLQKRSDLGKICTFEKDSRCEVQSSSEN